MEWVCLLLYIGHRGSIGCARITPPNPPPPPTRHNHHHSLQHSLGVAYLAETFVRTLLRNQPELLARGPERVLDKDILCVKVAGTYVRSLAWVCVGVCCVSDMFYIRDARMYTRPF
jgi:hypothetical protein